MPRRMEPKSKAQPPSPKKKRNLLASPPVSPKTIAEFRRRFEEFDRALAFVRRHRLPTAACSIRAWPWGRDHGAGVPSGFSNSAENVAMSICHALATYRLVGEDDLGELEDLAVRRAGGTACVHRNGRKIVSFSPMTVAEVKHVYATATLREMYPHFDSALEFVRRHKLPTCRCSVHAMFSERLGELSWGYSASAEECAAAVARAWQDYLEECDETTGYEDLAESLYVRRRRPTTYVRIEEWDLIRFTRVADNGQRGQMRPNYRVR